MIEKLMTQVDEYVETRLKYGAAEYNHKTWDARADLQTAMVGLTGDAAAQRIAELEQACAEGYVAVGQLLVDTGQWDTEQGQNLLDTLNEGRVYKTCIPWPSVLESSAQSWGDKDANLKLSLETGSGYSARQSHTINLDQWKRIQAIVNEYHGE